MRVVVRQSERLAAMQKLMNRRKEQVSIDRALMECFHE